MKRLATIGIGLAVLLARGNADIVDLPPEVREQLPTKIAAIVKRSYPEAELKGEFPSWRVDFRSTKYKDFNPEWRPNGVREIVGPAKGGLLLEVGFKNGFYEGPLAEFPHEERYEKFRSISFLPFSHRYGCTIVVSVDYEPGQTADTFLANLRNFLGKFEDFKENAMWNARIRHPNLKFNEVEVTGAIRSALGHNDFPADRFPQFSPEQLRLGSDDVIKAVRANSQVDASDVNLDGKPDCILKIANAGSPTHTFLIRRVLDGWQVFLHFVDRDFVVSAKFRWGIRGITTTKRIEDGRQSEIFYEYVDGRLVEKRTEITIEPFIPR